MTLEEAKKILVKAGYTLYLQGSSVTGISCLSAYDGEDMLVAWQCCARNGLIPAMSEKEFNDREARLKKEYEAKTTAPKADISSNPALKESAKEFNDELLSEQKLKLDAQNKLLDGYRGVIVQRNNTIYELGEKVNHRDKKISKLSKVISKKNKLIGELRDEIDERVTKLVAVSNENQELEKKLSEYANKLADVCDELRGLKKKHADVVVNNVNAQALKSAENALKEKDEVIDDLSKEIAKLYKMVHGDPILNMKERKKMGEPLSMAECVKEARESITETFKSYYDLKDKAYDSFNKKACDLGFTGSKSGKGILDRMEVNVDLGKGESYTSSVIVIPKDADPTLLRNIFKDMSDIINSEL